MLGFFSLLTQVTFVFLLPEHCYSCLACDRLLYCSSTLLPRSQSSTDLLFSECGEGLSQPSYALCRSWALSHVHVSAFSFVTRPCASLVRFRAVSPSSGGRNPHILSVQVIALYPPPCATVQDSQKPGSHLRFLFLSLRTSHLDDSIF